MIKTIVTKLNKRLNIDLHGVNDVEQLVRENNATSINNIELRTTIMDLNETIQSLNKDIEGKRNEIRNLNNTKANVSIRKIDISLMCNLIDAQIKYIENLNNKTKNPVKLIENKEKIKTLYTNKKYLQELSTGI